MAQVVAVIASTHHPFYYRATTATGADRPPFADEWVAKMKVLLEAVEHHAEEEEQEMLPRAKELGSERLGERAAARAQVVERSRRVGGLDGADDKCNQRAMAACMGVRTSRVDLLPGRLPREGAFRRGARADGRGGGRGHRRSELICVAGVVVRPPTPVEISAANLAALKRVVYSDGRVTLIEKIKLGVAERRHSALVRSYY